jgi:hypothetical protein
VQAAAAVVHRSTLDVDTSQALGGRPTLVYSGLASFMVAYLFSMVKRYVSFIVTVNSEYVRYLCLDLILIESDALVGYHC